MMRRRGGALAAAALALACTVAQARTAAAQDQADLAREIAALRAEVQQLRARLDALTGAAAAEGAAPPSLDILQAQVAELAQTKVESTTKMPVRLFGTVHAGVFANSANANWLDNPNIITATPADGHAGTTSASLRQTRIGIAADGPTLGSARTNAVVAMDFFGGIPGFQTGQVMGLPRLLVAYARIEGAKTALQVGQDHVILAPRDPTSLAAYAFPLMFRSGNLYLRAPQVRVERAFASRLRTMAGIVAPIGGDLVGDAYVFVPPPLGGERSRRPGVQARVAYTVGEATDPRLVDIGISGHTGWERRGAVLVKSWAGAVDFAARRDAIGVAGEIFVGDNADAFGGATGLDARSGGGWGELQLFPTSRVAFNAGGGVDRLRGIRRLTLARGENRTAFGNVIVSLSPEVQASFEYRWLRTLAGTTERPNHHFDWVLIHKF